MHGNATVPDPEVIRLAGLAVGQPLEVGMLEAAERRLSASGLFDSVEARKRYRSLSDPGDVALVLVVHEKPGVVVTASGSRRRAGPFGRLGDRLMFLPILSYVDGYGSSYGGRVSARGLLGAGEHLSVPLTWGGTRGAAVEVDRTFEAGPLTRLGGRVGIRQCENPHVRLDDRRLEVKGRAERQVGRFVRTGVEASRAGVNFGGADDRLWTLGTDVALDTRADPGFPRNAFLIGAGWTGLHVRSRRERIDRVTGDARGYVGLVGQAVAATRVQYSGSTSALPPFERLLLGGASTLRGFRAGTFAGDRTLVTSVEVRVPLSSVLSTARVGVLGLVDAGRAWNVGARFGDARWHRGYGGGVFLIAPPVRLNLAVARAAPDGATRVHLAAGFAF